MKKAQLKHSAKAIVWFQKAWHIAHAFMKYFYVTFKCFLEFGNINQYLLSLYGNQKLRQSGSHFAFQRGKTVWEWHEGVSKCLNEINHCFRMNHFNLRAVTTWYKQYAHVVHRRAYLIHISVSFYAQFRSSPQMYSEYSTNSFQTAFQTNWNESTVVQWCTLLMPSRGFDPRMLVEIRQKLSSTYTPLVSGSPKAKPLLSALENAFSRNNIGGILKQHTRVKIPLLLSSYFRINESHRRNINYLCRISQA